MKKILAVLLMFLAGCGVKPLATGKTDGLPDIQVKAQLVLNEGYRVLAAADKEIGQAAQDRIFTPTEAQGYLNRAIDARKELDKYQKLVGSAPSTVLTQAGIQQAIADALLKEVLARAAAAKKPRVELEPIFLSA